MTISDPVACGSVVVCVASRWRSGLSIVQAAVDALLFRAQKYCVAPRLGDLVVERRLRARLRRTLAAQLSGGLRPMTEQVRHET